MKFSLVRKTVAVAAAVVVAFTAAFFGLPAGKAAAADADFSSAQAFELGQAVTGATGGKRIYYYFTTTDSNHYTIRVYNPKDTGQINYYLYDSTGSSVYSGITNQGALSKNIELKNEA